MAKRKKPGKHSANKKTGQNNSRPARVPVYRRCPLRILICLFLIGATFLAVEEVRHHPFVGLDDDQYITDNRHVKSGLSIDGFTWAFTTTWDANWFPLTWLSLMLDCQLFGSDPSGPHLINLLFHLANTVLLFLVFQRMTGKLWQSAFVAALFALHPLHVESVAWVTERKDVLSAFFWIMTMWAYAGYAEKKGHQKYLWVIIFFTLGLMSKPMVVTLPFVLLLLDFWPLGRLRPPFFGTEARALVLEKIPLFVLSAASSVITFLVQRGGGAVGSLDVLPLPLRLANILVSYASYMGKMVWPQHLAVYYPFLENLPLWEVAASALLLIGITLLAIKFGPKHPYLPVGWFWYLGTLVPVIGLVQVGAQAMADRYTYIPLIGLFLIVAMGVPEGLTRWRHRKNLVVFCGSAALAVLIVVSRAQVSYWQDSIRLFEHTLAITSDNYLIHNNLGNALERSGRIEEAIAHYKETLRIKPDNARTYFNLGNALSRRERADEAIRCYREALRLKPDYAEAHNNLGNVFERLGDRQEAMVQYREALRLKPEYAEARSNLGIVLAKRGKIEEAMGHFKEAIRIDPGYEKAYHNLGVSLAEQGRTREAIAQYRRALQINPDFREARFSVGLAYAKIGDRHSALEESRVLRRIDPNLANRLLEKISAEQK